MFIAFDGIDGSGKSTQAAFAVEWLRARGRDVVACRDPGSTPLGEAIRKLLLDPNNRIDMRSEMLLYMAARAQLVDEVIRPALAEGKDVVSDRFLLANLVYQGHAGGLPVAELREVGRIAVGGVYPDVTILLDLPLSAARRRLERPLDRLEQRDEMYQEQVRQGFLAEAAAAQERIQVIDAQQDAETMHGRILKIIEKYL